LVVHRPPLILRANSINKNNNEHDTTIATNATTYPLRISWGVKIRPIPKTNTITPNNRKTGFHLFIAALLFFSLHLSLADFRFGVSGHCAARRSEDPRSIGRIFLFGRTNSIAKKIAKIPTTSMRNATAKPNLWGVGVKTRPAQNRNTTNPQIRKGHFQVFIATPLSRSVSGHCTIWVAVG